MTGPLVGIAIVVAALLLLVITGSWPKRRPVVSESRARVTRLPGLENGAELARSLLVEESQRLHPDENGAVPFLQAMWPANLSPDEQPLMCAHLGFPIPVERGMTPPTWDKELEASLLQWWTTEYLPKVPTTETTAYEPIEWEDEEGQSSIPEMTPEEIAEAWSGFRYWEVLLHATRNPWKKSELEPLAQWIARQEKHLELLHESGRRRFSYLPPPTLLTVPEESLLCIVSYVSLAARDGAYCLSMRGMLSLGEGDAEGAWRDCEAIYRLADHLSSDHVAIQNMAGTISRIGDHLAHTILDSVDLTPGLAKCICTKYRQRPMRSAVASAVDKGERLSFTTFVIEASKQQGLDEDEFEALLRHVSLTQYTRSTIDWNVVLRVGHFWFDAIYEIVRTELGYSRIESLKKLSMRYPGSRWELLLRLMTSFFDRRKRSTLIADTIAIQMLSIIVTALVEEERANNYVRLNAVAAALADHRLCHGDYPARLDELDQSLIDSEPMDVYGNALIYSRSNGGYLLHSCGLDGIDDGGSNLRDKRWEGYDVEELGQLASVVAGFNQLGLPMSEIELTERIPPSADDWSIRLPLQRPKLPTPYLPPPQD